jgi:hypothetical protein
LFSKLTQTATICNKCIFDFGQKSGSVFFIELVYNNRL